MGRGEGGRPGLNVPRRVEFQYKSDIDFARILSRPEERTAKDRDAQWCNGNQTWSMRRRDNRVISDFKITADADTPGKLFFYTGALYEKLVWFSGSNQDSKLTLLLDQPIFVVLWYNGNKSSLNHRKGFIITYSTRHVSTPSPASEFIKCNLFCPKTIFIASFAILSLLIILAPPIICAKITQRLRQHAILQHSITEKECDRGVAQSPNTDSTRILANKSNCLVSQRSIGIQLSVQNTPRFSHNCLPVESTLPRGASSSIASDELEYDYYDGTTIPGSLLAPVNDHMLSVIDIDQIIAQSSVFPGNVDSQNAHTQI
ncbi:hypothetical protein DICVIV_11188 [Dictyocaulus viviparus]|uniref:Uncharacterized protein n=1 Tax=Dictyocaulus viviparus TaxID=29172 RepID=A0A0D8XDV3_DICVI|nr:hypothetical protein DICVIV_11188 [Dictyocaulus viviparus]